MLPRTVEKYKAIAQRFKDTNDVALVRREFNVSETTVYTALRECGVPSTRYQNKSLGQFRQLKVLAGWMKHDNASQRDYASQIGVSHAYVQQVLDEARNLELI